MKGFHSFLRKKTVFKSLFGLGLVTGLLVLGLGLMWWQGQQREMASLKALALGTARQAESLVTEGYQKSELDELVSRSAQVGKATVAMYDYQGNLMSASSEGSEAGISSRINGFDGFVWRQAGAALSGARQVVSPVGNPAAPLGYVKVGLAPLEGPAFSISGLFPVGAILPLTSVAASMLCLAAGSWLTHSLFTRNKKKDNDANDEARF